MTRVTSSSEHDLVLVPREPTMKMVYAAVWALDRWREKHGDPQMKIPTNRKYQIRWQAMIEAWEESCRKQEAEEEAP
jgi:hypothetical protein